MNDLEQKLRNMSLASPSADLDRRMNDTLNPRGGTRTTVQVRSTVEVPGLGRVRSRGDVHPGAVCGTTSPATAYCLPHRSDGPLAPIAS